MDGPLSIATKRGFEHKRYGRARRIHIRRPRDADVRARIPRAGNGLPVLPKLRLPARSAHEHGYCGGRSSVTTDGGNSVIKRSEHTPPCKFQLTWNKKFDLF
ncbi:unnamed protein product [Macrosiphum euphorbiae]|uniref:Uncharacterized protein n=1 Tax=Macrosiphum euphorbiae TaxID=13131 RepID=A0AAV0VQE2_9HEMI|nr:unnamed protein product [Macrosiphum euphorbiae]CAI6344134.1 unnamed protein product [Macrosiphum euphorbiae]CAI6345953.1 unnamed protein product [Macrosiphum euphorbiae]CAI6346409.1 unnamed protein product [Macrosiphum euphorbiae]CAI6347494.1 unnamed protein product [Macrosiphum euphorbiae]